MQSIEELLNENESRMSRMYGGFDPLTGEGAPPEPREWIEIEGCSIPRQYIPVSMLKSKFVKALVKHKSIQKFITQHLKLDYTPESIDYVERALCQIRCKHDFAFWAFMFVRIKPKQGGDNIPFKLRHEQRYVLALLEEMRLAGKPIRAIMLKARQWGGSTLVQIYFAWIQLVLKKGWYSTIIAQTLGTARTIKAMYSKLLAEYPAWLLDIDEDVELEFSPYEGSSCSSIITYGNNKSKVVARDAVITVGTFENPDATRGTDTSLIHYSEVAIWNETQGKKPEDIIRSVSGGLLEVPLTAEVLESTANGTGNFFHREWERAKAGESNRKPIFVPWYLIEQDAIPVDDKRAFAEWLLTNKDNPNTPEGFLDSGQYYWYLWQQGATFDGINWYRTKRKSVANHADMASEAPSNDIEAFTHSGQKVFDIYQLETLRATCTKAPLIGEVQGDAPVGNKALQNLHFNKDRQGKLHVWSLPETDIKVTNRYAVIVDIGGLSTNADFSVIRVFDRFPMVLGGIPELVAQWRGHIDHDFLAWKAAQIANFYNKALLVYESNTLETKDKERDTDGDHSEFILNQIKEAPVNLYYRRSSEADIVEGKPRKIGFHTNTHTKPLIIDFLRMCVRDASWVERDSMCIDELGWYERKQNGSYGAISGQHDDILMATAIGLYIIYREMDMPKVIEESPKSTTKTYSLEVLNEATF